MQLEMGIAPARAVAATGIPARIGTLIRNVTGAAVAVLVVAEILVLFAGVLARYVFHAPLIWSDELASILFLWLAMLGAVVAFERGEHMRMSAFVGGLRQPFRGFFDALAIAVPLLFLSLALGAAYEFAVDEIIVSTPALDISAGWRVAALPVGFALMHVLAVLRLIERTDWRVTLAAVALVVVAAAIFAALRPSFTGLGNLNLLIFFVGLVGAMVLAGIPIAFAFATATFGYIALTTRLPHSVVIGRMDEGMSHFVLLSVPLFVFLGVLIEMTGMARAMLAFLASLLGHVRGGLQYVLVGAMYLVSGISGSKAADMAAIAPVLLPEMEKRGADRGELLALLAATGAQTETIPPSLVLITIGSVTGVSIAALFAVGLMPALVVGALLCCVVWLRSRKDDLSGVRRASFGEIAKALVVALPAIALPFIIRAAVIEGVATATEVSTIGIAYALLAGLLIYRRFDWRRLYPMLVDTAALSGAILLIIGAATGMAWALTQSGFSAALAHMMTSLPGGAVGFMLVSLVAFIVLGSLLEGIPAIVLFGPLLFPIARQVGVNEVHYSMVVILAMGIGLFAPPFGVGYYAASAISRIRPDEGMRPMIGYIAALFIGTLIVAAVPWISTGFIR
ncbi:tripartite ATP-independent transporter DctM subunit [Xanthobacter flavus]|uniref:ABC transporter permease n=2 Tax=Xanthobacter flavus TaxID=281 RepID=A0A9W6FM91_XANFL|nr:TRAP transporter large permease subunit [Xanthobacter flavus]MDR6334831.1 tripartite ATP-independent transporter DctM subunit [Xanthobacter flavus]GLI23147.1 ABC transporter permease [Xanthobacter flavus]